MVNAEQEYERRKASAECKFAVWQSRAGWLRASTILLLLVLVFAVARWIEGERLGWIGATVSLVALIASLIMMLRANARRHHAMRVNAFYERGLERVRGDNLQAEYTGEEFVGPGHLFAQDLNVVGPNSLFGMLALTRTALGHKALAAWLLHAGEASVIAARQESVRELTGDYDLRERVALLGHSGFEKLPANSFEEWLSLDDKELPRWLRPLLLALTAGWIAVLISGLLLQVESGLLLRNVLAVLALQGLVSLRFRQTVRAELQAAERLSSHVTILRQGLVILQHWRFTSDALIELATGVIGSETMLKSLDRQLGIVEQRSKEQFYLVSLLFGTGTQVAISLRTWKRKHGAAIERWLRAWSEFDTFVALCTYAAEHPENTYPEFVETGCAVFRAKGMVHPLLPTKTAVANDVELDGETQMLLISGSNMAGKSTLLRAIGANAVLAKTGVPVPAASLALNTLHIGASLALSDSLAEGRSKFLAEVERLHAIVELAKTHPAQTLFLIDEVFSGTNSLDRKAAAEAVVRGLVASGAVGALSTHDLTLTEIAQEESMHAKNVHMASPDESEPLGFDYKLKAGVNKTTNAMAIVRMLGLAVDASG